MYINRLFYFLYFLKKTNFHNFLSDINFVNKHFNKGRLCLILDSIYSSFRYNISLEDYFIFSFFKKDHLERSKWAGTGYMYEYQKFMNLSEKVVSLEDKLIFLEKYNKFVKRDWFSISNLSDLKAAIEYLISKNQTKFVAKFSKGQTGSSVEIIYLSDIKDINNLYKYFKNKNYNLIESFVEQSDYLANISSSGLNTLRVITQINSNHEVEVLGARLRLTVNSPIDNLSAGNFAVALDVNTGAAISDGVYMNIQKMNIKKHPISLYDIKDISIPNWNNIIDFVKEVAALDKDLKSVGWDVAILNDSLELIEGNHNWGKTLYQLPINQGCKGILDQFKEGKG